MTETAESRAGDIPPLPAPATTGSARRDVRLFWWSNTADALGSQTSGVVLPLLLLALGYPPAAVGVIVGASAALGLLLGPLAAVPADRGARKPVMVWSASVAALAMAGVAAAVASGRPPLALVLGGVLVERFCTAVYEAASRGTVAMICPPAGYPRLVARLEVGDRIALVLGPVLGGALYQVGRAWPFVADALSYAATAWCIRSMRADLSAPGATTPTAETPGATTPRAEAPGATTAYAESAETPGVMAGLRTELAAGLRLVAGSAVLRPVLLWTSVVNGVLAALYFGMLLTLQRDGHSGTATGAVLAVAGAAGIVGALTAPALSARLGATRSVLAVTWVLVPLAAALAATRSPWAQAALFGGICLTMPVATVVLQSRAIAATPPYLQARAGAVLATAAGAAAAVGPVMAGVLVARVGGGGPSLGSAGVLTVLALYVSWARLRTPAHPGGAS
ncbi:MFS transporter [Streptomyces sp. NPDC048442]|uniref:MFS transporter n=1 Tax=Streptomyces sp. NPDC048442 TaxID=3154823 RepID=UPI003444088C